MKEAKIEVVGSIKPERKIQDNCLVYSGGGISPCIRARDYKDPVKVLVYEQNTPNRNDG